MRLHLKLPKGLHPRFIQVGCPEINKTSRQQGKAVLQYRPDIIMEEAPCRQRISDSIFNKYPPQKKPLKEVAKRIKKLEYIAATIHPWAGSDILVWKNIIKLWKDGHNTLFYNIDAPPELTGEWLVVWNHMYPCAVKNWLWWVQIYLRERCMADHIISILSRYHGKKRPVILLSVEKFHWLHVKFLLSEPTKKEIWDYYFGKFFEVSPDNIGHKIRHENGIFYKYWRRFSDFV